LEIKTPLQNAPRDEEKLEQLLKVKEMQKEEAMHIEDAERLVTEIEMLKVKYYLVVSRGGEEDKIIAPHSLSVKSSLSKKRKREERVYLFILSWWCRA
jgi:hypothetical protein